MDLSTIPRGLLSLLGIQNFGEGPRTLSPQIVGTVDLLSMYGLNGRTSAFDTQNVISVGGNTWVSTNLVVPANEIWLVHSYGLEVTPGAGAAIDLAPAWQLGPFTQMNSVGDYVAATAGQNARPFAKFNGPFLANPGSVFGFNVRSFTLNSLVAGFIVMTRLRA